ncbi:MAG: DUF2281 domain-containing protein [Candidatus Methylumidiphilus sp.]
MSAVIEHEIIERLHNLDEPKLLEVLDFVEFLAQRRANPQPCEPVQRARGAMQGMLSKTDEFIARKTDEPNQFPESDPRLSFYDLTKAFCGCIEGGPSDLSTNPKYMEGFGE